MCNAFVVSQPVSPSRKKKTPNTSATMPPKKRGRDTAEAPALSQSSCCGAKPDGAPCICFRTKDELNHGPKGTWNRTTNDDALLAPLLTAGDLAPAIVKNVVKRLKR